MDHDERRPRFHIHIFGLIIFIIIVLVLFKVDIVSKIKSEQFQENVSYIKTEALGLWNKYLVLPITSKVGDFIMDSTQKEINKIQDNIKKNIIKTPDLDESNN